MEMNSPYLEAIQAIPGSTPGQKFRELNAIVQKIAESTKAHGDSAPAIRISEVPEALLPLVRVEVANGLRQSDGVVEALKSEDSVVVDRALRMNWFFRGDNRDVINVDYFKTHILPYVTLNTRIKLIKRLALNLRTSGHTKLGEDFYDYFSRKYGRKQAEPLFIACGEDFIYESVTKHKTNLSCRIVKNLFLKYPELIIRYLKLSKPDEDGCGRKNSSINIYEYNFILPRLIKKHVNAFIELIEMHGNGLNVQLSNKLTETFLKNNVDALLNRPCVYICIMPMKVITAKLTKAQFETMCANLYPEKLQDFTYNDIGVYLEFYPEQERLSLILETYKEVYNANLLDNHDAIGEELLCMLPLDERARQARIKLEKEPDWRKHRHNISQIWRCYLPIEESIPSIKTEISKSSAAEDRNNLLSQMFYTCKVNNDDAALIEALRYFTTRHKNEQVWIIFDVLDHITEFFDVFTLGKEHWAILDEFIRFLYVKDQLSSNITVAKKILAGNLYYDLVHNRPIENKIDAIVKLNIDSWNPSWSILEKYPEYDKRCFDALLTTIPSKYPQDDNIWKTRRCEILASIVKSIYEFNARNVKANNKVEKLSVRNYPWLFDALKNVIQKEKEERNWQLESIISILKINEPELYKEWIPIDEDAALSMATCEALNRLRNDPHNILDHWEAYLKEAKSYATGSYGRRFLTVSRWHQDIPIKFVKRCLKDVAENVDDVSGSLLVLGVLMEGPAFAKVIEPLVPKTSTIEITHEESKDKYKVISTIPHAMNMTNPPVPLSLILSFCEGDYLDLALASLTNACRRTSIEKIKPFTEKLIDNRVSVKKHGIRLYCLVATIDDLKIFLTDLWKNETHRSIRAVVFDKIYNLFVTEPTPDTWAIMKRCIVDLKIDDDDSFENLAKIYNVPYEYFADYIKQLLETLEKLKANGFSASRIVSYISRVISGINAVSVNLSLLPEDFCRELLRRYFMNPIYEKDISESATNYALDSYIRPNKSGLESRLSFFCDLYKDILKKRWNVPYPKRPTVCPVNYLSRDFIERAVFAWDDNVAKITILEAILKSYAAVLKPEQDFFSYTLLVFSIAFKEAKTAEDIGIKISETLPLVVDTLSTELIVEITNVVKQLIEHRFSNADEKTDEIYKVIETLCNTDTVHSCILAAKLLYVDEKPNFDDRHNKIVEILRQSKHPAVVSLVNHHVNTNGVWI